MIDDDLKKALNTSTEIIIRRLNNPEITKKIPIDRLLQYNDKLLRQIAFIEGVDIKEDGDGNQTATVDPEMRERIQAALGIGQSKKE
jgi:hypothetical protein